MSTKTRIYCRVISTFGNYEVGQIITPSKEHRGWLLHDKLVEVLGKRDTINHEASLAERALIAEQDDEEIVVEAAMAAEPETAVVDTPRRRGRPRKDAVTE